MKARLIVTVLVALFALAALPAAASADGGFVAGEYPAVARGEDTWGKSPGHLTLHYSDVEIWEQCSSPTFEGELEAPAHAIESTVTGNGTCSYFEDPLKMNGCQFELHRDTNTADIGPPGCGPIEAPSHGWCGWMKIDPKTGMTASFENVGSGSEAAVNVSVSGEGLKYEATSRPPQCQKGTYEGLELTASWQMRAYENVEGALGKQVGLEAVDAAPSIGVSREEGKFDAQEFPVGITAKRAAGGDLTLLEEPESKLSVTCETAQLGGGVLSEPATELALSGGFGGCDVGVNPAAVRMNSCSYELGESTEISCAEPGDQVEVAIDGYESFKCLNIPPQVIDNEAPQYENQGEGDSASVEAGLTGAEIEYTAGFLCQLIGWSSGTEGSSALDLELEGSYPW